MPILPGPDKKYPKHAAAIIVAKALGEGEPLDRPIGNTDEVMAAKDFLTAIDTKDPGRLLRAFKTLYAVCESQEHEILGEDEDDEGEGY